MKDMKTMAWAYLTFVGFLVFTNLVVRPAVKQFNIPLLKDSL